MKLKKELIGQVEEWVEDNGLMDFGCALAANKIYDREEIWRLLEMIFSFFKKKK